MGRADVISGIHYRYPDQLKTVSALTSFRHPSAPEVLVTGEEGFPLGTDSRTTPFPPKDVPGATLGKLFRKEFERTECSSRSRA